VTVVVGFTGHQDISEEALPLVRGMLGSVLRDFRGEVTGLSSLAAGSDQLFAEIALQLSWKLNVVIPCLHYDETFTDQETLGRFRDLLAKANSIEMLAHPFPTEDAYLDAGKHIVGLCQALVAVWDGREAKGKGGTADVVRYARQRGLEITVVWPPGLVR
jgi:hypothetical protein